jgi:NSS family neurotransmitter:Na+ symporter
LIAALTSAVSLLEVPVACMMEQLSWSRSRAVWVSAALIFVAGLPAATSMDVLGWMDAIFGGILLIIGGLLLSVLMGWVIPQRFEKDLVESGTPVLIRFLVGNMLRWISLPIIGIGLIVSIADLWLSS